VDLTVVIPVFNEVESIRELVEEVRSRLDGKFDYEVVVVDDGSTDSTSAVLMECRRGFPRLRVLHHQTCCGQSAAVCTGVDAAEAPVIATLDGDGQNDPADIPALYQAWRGATAGVSLVTGYRRRRHDTWLKRFSSRVANAVRGGFLNDNTPDTGCGLKVFSRETFRLLPRFDHMHRFLPALVQMQGGKTLSVEVNHRERRRGTSKYGMFNRLWVGIVDLLGVKWLQRRTRRPVVSELL
jgi:dolichol-phosphate mannosyltransferase